MGQLLEARRGLYRDSVALMRATQAVRAVPGVEAALVAMATPLNLDMLAGMGFAAPDGAGPNDLLVAIRAVDDAALARARETLEAQLADPGRGGGLDTAPAPRTTGSAARHADATVAVVAVPGRYAFAEAVDALEAGLHALVFSDNVPLAQEVRLKREAAERGLLVMGPDCGTAVIGGVGLGFANAVRPGPVGLVAASGTGAQQVMCLLDAAGVGVTHCLGVGGRDLSAPVGGLATRQALALLDEDPATELIVLISKPPAPGVAEEIVEYAAKLTTPVEFAFLGPDADDLSAVAARVVARVTGQPPGPWPRWAPDSPPVPRGGALRALYCGGTLCQEAIAIAARALGSVASNLDPTHPLGDDLRAAGHLAIDFGDDRFTQGRPHPVIDPAPRLERLAAELADPATGVVLLDVVLGHGAHPDPAADVAEVIRGATLPVVVALVGTEADPQGLARQARTLCGAGAYVFASNASAARHAVALAEGGAA
ncbi:FdrA family protein [Carbonactinospora thermoautotrophica]|uniref:FdrA family protein n=1 Tax=Carbonactinospora thermoautotrophica TaxID=1469144 RepID=A0A132MS88_9ACTN|nr:FdrA family protein [Carbonactinospora thermoautotrophica]KWX00748.1 FdrA family protein [Carbonactinospora thermoautotrophica]KWX05285.1 FdrA family protein [Carbonactinospora thermoautotrophica]